MKYLKPIVKKDETKSGSIRYGGNAGADSGCGMCKVFKKQK